MANANGDSGNNAGAQGGRPTAWSGSSTPPDVYGNFSRPGLADDMMEASDIDRTAEDMSPPTDVRTAHVVRQSLHNHLAELEESGEYDIRALAPLRHLLDQDWTDPNVRSRLKAKVEAEDARTAQATPGTGTTQAKEWFANLNESPANAETVQVPVAADSAKTPAQPQVRPPAPATPATTPPQQRPAALGPGLPQASTVRPAAAAPTNAAPKVAGTAITRPPNPAAAAILSQSVAHSQSPAALPVQEASESLVFDEEPGDTGQTRARSRALKLLSKVPSKVEEKGKVRPWVLATGAILVVAALAVPKSAFSSNLAAPAPASFVLTSEPKAEIFRGDERLGETPMLIQADGVGDGLTLRQAGFESQTFTLNKPISESKVEKHKVVLNVAPVAIDWTGLPANSQLTWQGKPATAKSLATAMPGTYSLKVAPSDRPAVTVAVVVPPPGAHAEPVAPGKQVEQALSQQPALSMTISAGKAKGAKLPLAVSISQSGGGKFSQKASLDGKAASKLVLPGPGTYMVKVPASATHQAFSKTITAKAGHAQNLEIALTPVPPRAAVAQAPSSGGGGGYDPAPTYYAPAPAYYSGAGGGGGGGRIAPPSF